MSDDAPKIADGDGDEDEDGYGNRWIECLQFEDAAVTDAWQRPLTRKCRQFTTSN